MGAAGDGVDLLQWERMEAAADDDAGGGEVERILVSVRLRPLSEKELAANEQCDWECIDDATIIFRNNVPERSMPSTAYTFDRVFSPDCTTMQVYNDAAKEVALSVVSGINSTIFAYGQTSSGKTYTMSGITEYTVQDIYDYINRHEKRAFVLKFSAIEIYNEAVKDLLSTDNTPLRLLDDPEKGTIVEKLTEVTLRDWNHLGSLISVCEAQRKVGETSLNETSSRSHQILRLTVESSAREFLGKGNSSTLVASVNFVDLAGSERASQALSAGTRLKEGCHINRSLLTLGTVIRKLSKGRNGHVPYRDSKLTRILQPSLGGNARTAIICTLSPARSHFEQSRNTLFFASCAKEVVTNAQVNIVMSDKALVKHLQKEVARLENELRYPGLSPNVEALLREKDAQIKKMDKQIKELIMERDKAQSHLERLLQAVDVDGVSGQWDESSRISISNAPYTCENVHAASGPSDAANEGVDSFSAMFTVPAKPQYLQLVNASISQLKHSNSPAYSMLAGDLSEEVDQNRHEGYQDPCKDVCCIETNEEGRSEYLNPSFTERGDGLHHANREPTQHRGQAGLCSHLDNDMMLEQHLHTVRNNFNNMLLSYPDLSSPRSSEQNFLASKRLPFRRSRSCRSTVMSISSWLKEVEQNDSTPPSRDLKDFPGRPEGLPKKRVALNYDVETGKLSREGSTNSTSTIAQTPLSQQVSSEVEAAGIHDFVAELKQMAQVQYRKQHFSGQESEESIHAEIGVNGTVKRAGFDPTLDPMQSPSRWLEDFEQKQHEIIELWHSCNISLLHRTYFFILFKGDPTDSIYMEVELRRLSFLKSTLTRENSDKSATVLLSSKWESSTKKLRRERDMLCRQMQKRLSAEERENLYSKWGIALDSKQRKLKLAKRIWSETKDLEHVRESASLVKRLIGIKEQGQALKEMFGLSFTPQEPGRKFHSWKNGLYSLR